MTRSLTNAVIVRQSARASPHAASLSPATGTRAAIHIIHHPRHRASVLTRRSGSAVMQWRSTNLTLTMSWSGRAVRRKGTESVGLRTGRCSGGARGRGVWWVQICVAGYDRHQHCTMVAHLTEGKHGRVELGSAFGRQGLFRMTKQSRNFPSAR